jgi:DNA-binding SARP family transcriptional activator
MQRLPLMAAKSRSLRLQLMAAGMKNLERLRAARPACRRAARKSAHVLGVGCAERARARQRAFS